MLIAVSCFKGSRQVGFAGTIYKSDLSDRAYHGKCLMDRSDFANLLAFQAVANAGSFTRAAAKLGKAQSGLSQAVSALEARIGVPLLARSTRSVRLTEAGQRLLEQVAPALDQIDRGMSSLRQDREAPSGTLRLTAMDHAARAILIPALAEFSLSYPDVRIDIHVSDRFVDIVENGFDAGVRFGAHLEKDMVALPISQDIRAVTVASPAYFARRGRPMTIDDLADHDRIDYRTASHGDLFRWVFRRGHRTVEVPPLGRTTVNDAHVLVSAALAGMGLAYTFEPHVADHLQSGQLQKCLEKYCPIWSGYHLYFPGRKQKSASMVAFVEFLKFRRDVHTASTDLRL
jgi:DNA-binding transcriptional LysR family regulator